MEAASNPEEILARAKTLFRAEQAADLRDLVAESIEELRRYDVPAMDRVAAIVMWGRSGSLLLASYLDGHPDVIMFAEDRGQLLYQFFERYRSLPWRDKLIAYAAFQPHHTRLFEGDFAISPARYYAAVQAVFEFYGKWPPEFLESRRAFFLFAHIAYNLALGRRPASSRPLIVYPQHVWDNRLAEHLVEDFPRAKFVHTVRDPISSCNGIFRYHLQFVENHILLPYTALFLLADKDRPHFGMESRTRAVRFEDLHRDSADTMRDLADWLGLSYRAALLDSTFNGIPYVVTRDGKSWSGRRSEQIQRRSEDVSRKDRALLFALFYENFLEWDYPCPTIFGHPAVRCLVLVSLVLFPAKMEFVAARAVFKRRILPALRRGNISLAIKSSLGIAFCRLNIMWLLTSVFFRRLAFGAALLQVDPKGRPMERRDDVARATSETKLN